MVNVFYWNSADDREHSHQRIEWSIENGKLVCINIKISDKLLNKVKTGDIILAYEPKEHKISKMLNGQDGKCMSCSYSKNNGRQSFTHAFKVTSNIIIIRDFITFQNYELFRNWFSLDKHNQNINCYNEYFSRYFSNNFIIYIFPTNYLGKLEHEITTNKDSDKHKYKYYGQIRKGFNTFDDIYLTRIITRQFHAISLDNEI